MRRRRAGLLGLVLALLAAASVAPAAERRATPAVGDPAPEVRLGDQHGKPFVLAEALREREFVVLAFYPKAFTSG